MKINGYEIGSGADLRRVYLCGADLRETNLYRANLHGADLRRTNLSEVDLRGTDLSETNLSGADLSGTNLRGVNLYKACVSGTVLDPDNAVNNDVKAFKYYSKGFVIGYRTRKAGHISKYQDGRTYSADWFSTCKTECHPGLFVWPTIKQVRDFSGNVECISVKIPKKHIHKAGSKYRCRWFTVLGKVED